MRTLIKRLVPGPVLRLRQQLQVSRSLRREFAEDRRRYQAAMLPDDHLAHRRLTGRNLEAQVTKDYHRVEKGLALPAPRQPFGADVSDRLDLLVPLVDPAAAYLPHAASARTALHDWNGGGSLTDEVSPLRTPAERGIPDPDQFFTTRHSVRDYDARDVADDVLEHAVALAINTPSVCNRQAWHIRFYRGDDVARVLTFQNGNAGFRDTVPVVAVVTTDARMFAGAGERNQGWIEGGLFSMSFVWALHSLGVDSCMLNMSVTNDRAAAVRVELGMDDEELVVMMIAIGYGREGHRRARSPRRTTTEVIR